MVNIRVSNKILPALEMNVPGRKLLYVNHDLRDKFGLNELRLFQLIKMGYAPLSAREIHKVLAGNDAAEG